HLPRGSSYAVRNPPTAQWTSPSVAPRPPAQTVSLSAPAARKARRFAPDSSGVSHVLDRSATPMSYRRRETNTPDPHREPPRPQPPPPLSTTPTTESSRAAGWWPPKRDARR